MEHLAVSLNPAKASWPDSASPSLLARAPGHQHTLATFQSALDRMPWRLYEVRRAVLPTASDPGKTGRAARWLRTHATGTRAQMQAALTNCGRQQQAAGHRRGRHTPGMGQAAR